MEVLVEFLHIPETENSLRISKRTFLFELRRIPTNFNNTSSGKTYEYQDTKQSGMNSQSVFLPQELLELVKNDSDNISAPSIVLATYRLPSLFLRRHKDSNLQINSEILSASIRRMNVRGLREPVIVKLDANVRNLLLIFSY